MEEASVILSGLDYIRIKQSLIFLSSLSKDDLNRKIVKDYNVDNVVKKL